MTVQGVTQASSGPRHARPAPLKSTHRRAREAATYLKERSPVSLRIPGPVDKAIGVVESHPLPVAGIGALLGAGAAAWLWQSMFTAIGLGIAGVVTGWLIREPRIAALQADNDQMLRDNAALESRVRHMERGDASAPTQLLRIIGELGETT